MNEIEYSVTWVTDDGQEDSRAYNDLDPAVVHVKWLKNIDRVTYVGLLSRMKTVTYTDWVNVELP